MTTTGQEIDNAGKPGTLARLEKIASLNLGERSEAAKKVLQRRYDLLDLVKKGYSYEDALFINRRKYD